MRVLDKYIFKATKALDHKTCNNLISLFERSDYKYDELHNYYLITPLLKDKEYSYLLPILKKFLLHYCDKHRFLKSRTYGWTLDYLFNFQKYLPGTCYEQHIDNIKYDGHMEHGKDDWNCRRLLGWMIYLNDIKKDGGTYWPQQRFTTKPRAGDLYIWPAGWTHSHIGIVAPNELKYILTGWCSLNP